MGFALHTLSSLSSIGKRPLRHITAWARPRRHLPGQDLRLIHPTVELAPPNPRPLPLRTLPCTHASNDAGPPSRALRVVHRNGHGRLVISGRMADVCAELNRLAAQGG